MKHLDQEDMQKHWNIILLLYLAISDLVHFQPSVCATVVQHTKLWVKLLMPLQTAVLPLLLMEIM